MKTVKIKDFDWGGFRQSKFCIVSDSSQNLLAVLLALSEKGYYWGMSGQSLIGDSVTTDQLLDDIEQELIYIRAGGDLEHGIICDYTDRRYPVMIDFKEDTMNMVKKVKAKDFDWVAFNKGKIAIAVDNEDPKELDEVLSILDKKGYTWLFSSKKITDKNSYTYKSLRSISVPFYLSVGGLEPDCNGIVWSGQTTINETPIRIDFKEDNMNIVEVKQVKAKDFDSEAFQNWAFRIAICSPKGMSRTLKFLHDKGYMWGNTKTSLLEDGHMKELLLDTIQRRPVFIVAGGHMRNGIVRDIMSSHNIPTVEIDFEEENDMITYEKVNAKEFDWKLFNDDRVAIVVDNRDTDNLNKVMKLLDNAGYHWSTDTPLTAKDAQGYKAITDGSHGHVAYLSTSRCAISRSVHWSTRLSSLEHPVKIVFDECTDNDKIVITNDGKTTTATLYSNGKKTGIGTAICHDDDKFDIYDGAKLALERLEKYKKEPEMTDWEKFVKGEVNMRVPKKDIRNFLDRAEKNGLTFKGTMSDWYLRWLTQEGGNIVVCVNSKIEKSPILTEVLHDDNGETVDYIPGMK